MGKNAKMSWGDERCIEELKRLDRIEQLRERINSLYIVRAAKYIHAKCTTPTARIKTKAWLWGALVGAGACEVVLNIAKGG